MRSAKPPPAEWPINENRAVGSLLPDDRLSRQHARIAVSAEGWVIQDLDSRNGVFVDGKRVLDETFPKLPRLLRVGQTLFRFTPDIRPFLRATVEEVPHAGLTTTEKKERRIYLFFGGTYIAGLVADALQADRPLFPDVSTGPQELHGGLRRGPHLAHAARPGDDQTGRDRPTGRNAHRRRRRVCFR